MREDREVRELAGGAKLASSLLHHANSLDHDYYGEPEKIKKISGN
jgi:hypothetical protein